MNVFQIVLGSKTGQILYKTQIIAESESDAIEKTKIGSIILELGLKREDVDFYISIVGVLYEGKTFAEPLSKTPILTTDEKSAITLITK